MEDREILDSIQRIVDDEHELREQQQRQEGDPVENRARLHELEESLDQNWDLLRQRRAHEEFDQDPDEASVRPAEVVERYWD